MIALGLDSYPQLNPPFGVFQHAVLTLYTVEWSSGSIENDLFSTGVARQCFADSAQFLVESGDVLV
jgi:hypothetical protein